jgi:hypothetical protein
MPDTPVLAENLPMARRFPRKMPLTQNLRIDDIGGIQFAIETIDHILRRNLTHAEDRFLGNPGRMGAN